MTAVCVRRKKVALAAERHTSIAIGILMERRKLSSAKAYELLRAESRPNRKKLAEVAKEIVASTEALTHLHKR